MDEAIIDGIPVHGLKDSGQETPATEELGRHVERHRVEEGGSDADIPPADSPVWEWMAHWGL